MSDSLDTRLRDLAHELVGNAPPPPPWPSAPSSRPQRPRRSPRRLVLTALTVLIVSALAVAAVIRVVGDDSPRTRTAPVATATDPSAANGKSRCVIRLTATPAAVCLTSYDTNHVSFFVSGFKPRTSFRAATPDGTTSAGGNTGWDGTNTSGPKKPETTRATTPVREGTTLSASAPILTDGVVVTGTAANGASVTFFVPPPSNTKRPTSDDEPRVAHRPSYLVIVDDTHLMVGAACNPYGPAVQATTKPHTIGLELFYATAQGATRRTSVPPTSPTARAQDQCLTSSTITLPGPIGKRDLVDATGATLGIDADNRCTPPRQGTRCDTP